MITANPSIVHYFLGFCGALLVSLILTYLVRNRALRAGLVDPCEDRKVHTRPVPRIGGVAIALTTALMLGGLVLAFGHEILGSLDGTDLLVILGGAAAIHLLGLLDDLRPLRARWKLLGQILIACAVFLAGVRMTTLSLPFVGIVELGSVAAMLLTVLWLVGLTNAFNLIDGLDGLAAGAALFAFTTLFVVASVNGIVGPAIVIAVVAGATLGFLFYNFHPASIFLGDSGSLFLGFMLAGVGLVGSQKSPAVVAVAIPLVALGLPVLDTALAIVRRYLRGQPIFSADRGHVHHRLLSLGHSPRKAALLLYGACAIFALGAMLLVNESGLVALVLIMVGLGVGLAIQRLRFTEFEELGRMVSRGWRQRGALGRGLRIREAALSLEEAGSEQELYETLNAIFRREEFPRVELRSRRPERTTDTSSAAGVEEELVWAWSRNGAPQSGCWEIRVPLRKPEGGDVIATLVLWQDGRDTVAATSVMRAIGETLRGALERFMARLDDAAPRRGYATAAEPASRSALDPDRVPLPGALARRDRQASRSALPMGRRQRPA